MTVNEQSIEKEIQAKGLNAPRLTPKGIDNIANRSTAHYWRVPGTAITVCCLVLPNGYGVIGYSAAVSIENYDEEIGKKIAWGNARNEIWALEGYLLRENLSKK